MLSRWMSRTRLPVPRPCLPIFQHDHCTVRSLRNWNTSTNSSFSTTATLNRSVPLRKELKDAAKAARGRPTSTAEIESTANDEWELTVGIEIHAQLNASRKLFSPGLTAPSTEPNSHLAPFDIALPGSQPILQLANILPALRAAIVLNCNIQKVSRFDRKHYFYHDQPAGYQITQYYQPFAKDGELVLTAADGLEDEEEVVVGIKQVQLEQDTARSQEQDSETILIDFNRCGHALIEIISLPHLHSARAAAAYVRKVQSLLYAVDAVTTGMEQGGLRADVNVSVRRRDATEEGHSYSAVHGLGQRTEIKNLSTFKGVEDAINAERDRQIRLLESGGQVEAETRGWSITNPHETRRLRGKEGEVDYRYMPDPDIPPLYIDEALPMRLRKQLPPTPDHLMEMLTRDYGVSPADARALVSLDDGERLIYFQETVNQLHTLIRSTKPQIELGQSIANWVLHELGALLSADEGKWTRNTVPVDHMAQILHLVSKNKITTASAKTVLKMVYNGDRRRVIDIVNQENLVFSEMSNDRYERIAKDIMAKFPQHVTDIVEKGKVGKIQFLMGQVLRHPEKGQMEPREAERTLRRLILGQ